MGKLGFTPKGEQFFAVNDEKLRMTLIGLSDKLSARIRDHIYRVYNDPQVESLYRGMRNSGIYEKGNWARVRHGNGAYRRKIVDFPSPYVYDFCNTVLSALYGPNWLSDDRALNHELVKQWWVVNKL